MPSPRRILSRVVSPHRHNNNNVRLGAFQAYQLTLSPRRHLPFLISPLAWISALLGLLMATSLAEVRLNEISAKRSDRFIIRNGDEIPHTGSGTQWWDENYDDSFWLDGRTPMGSGYPGIATTVASDVIGKALTFYVRQSFTATATEAASVENLTLDIDYCDGFVAYLNGKEIARGNTAFPGTYLYSSQPSFNSRTSGGFEAFAAGETSALLREGANILSVEVHNNSLGDALLKLDLSLSNAETTFIDAGTPCKWFPGIVSPSGGVFDHGLRNLVTGRDDDPEIEHSDWIELHNNGATAVDLSGWGLSDNTDPYKWVFPENTSIEANGYLVVIADGQDRFNGQGAYLHTNFRLSGSGETLTLTDKQGVLQSEIPNGFPAQYFTYTYGWVDSHKKWAYYSSATPGAANSPPGPGETFSARAEAPTFNVQGGFFDESQTINLASGTRQSEIRYTIDGTEPTPTTGIPYSGPFHIHEINGGRGTVIRARTFASDHIPSETITNTYLIAQHEAYRSVPALVFTGNPEEVFYKPYGILSIEGGTYTPGWTNTGPDSYNYASFRGIEFERPLFLEFYPPDGSPGFREHAGVRLSASNASRPRLLLTDTSRQVWSHTPRQKVSFNLHFRDDYGSNELNYAWHNEFYPVTSFEQLRLRAGKNDIRDPWIKDELVRRLYHDMGHVSSIGITTTLYLNGVIKGFYNMTERLREPFMQDHHGGTRDWDIRQKDSIPTGDTIVWNEMMTALGKDLTVLENWQAAEAYLDPVNMADYFLLNIYVATNDWPQNNWVGARERSPEGRYRLYVWDAEFSFGSGTHKKSDETIDSGILQNDSTLGALFRRLHASPEWRLLFADRINKHMFHGGVLDGRDGAASRLRRRADELRDEFSALKEWMFGGPVSMSFWTDWVTPGNARRDYLLGPLRTDFADNGLWPSVPPPSLSQHGGSVTPGYRLTMENGPGSTIYFTSNGLDPRLPGGAVSPNTSTYSNPIEISTSPVVIRARARDTLTGEWSALTEAEFNLGILPPSSENLAITEFMYNPPDPSTVEEAAGFSDAGSFEFIILKNLDPEFSVDLRNVVFSSGITFSFAGKSRQTLGPGQQLILVRDLAAFQLRYGRDLDPLLGGEYSASLSNGGETLTLSLVNGGDSSELISFTYSDKKPWPEQADGDGHSLVLVNPDETPDHDNPASWSASRHFGGDLDGNNINFDFQTWITHNFNGRDSVNPLLSGPSADPDLDGSPNYAEFALGTDPTDPNSLSQPSVSATGKPQQFTIFSFQRPGYALPLRYGLQVSDDLITWDIVPATNLVASPPQDHASKPVILEHWRIRNPTGDTSGRLFYRLVVSEKP